MDTDRHGAERPRRLRRIWKVRYTIDKNGGAR